ncbi:hypothetical protein OFB92_34205, partial [Escherichia coli]|nr:hypothetical protein [Escherichia coli]
KHRQQNLSYPDTAKIQVFIHRVGAKTRFRNGAEIFRHSPRCPAKERSGKDYRAGFKRKKRIFVSAAG